MMTDFVIPDFIVDELYIFFPAAEGARDEPIGRSGSGQPAPHSGRLRASGSETGSDPAEGAAIALSAGASPAVPGAGSGEMPAAPAGVSVAALSVAAPAGEADSASPGCLWGTFGRVEGDAVILDIATFDMERFRYGCRVPQGLCRVRRATRDEVRDFFYSLGRTEQRLEK